MLTKETKELRDISKAIRKWYDKHNGNVNFIGTFMAFDEKKDFEITDDMIVGFGDKKSILLTLTDLKKGVKEEKDFINW